MAFNIKIKPLVLFDLEDKIKLREHQADGEGRRFYQTFLTGLSDLQYKTGSEVHPVYEAVNKYVSQDMLCSLFYIVSGNTILVIGLL